MLLGIQTIYMIFTRTCELYKYDQLCSIKHVYACKQIKEKQQVVQQPDSPIVLSEIETFETI